MMRYAILLSFLLVLTACSTQAPLPTDHYYRLPELRDIGSDQERLNSISVLNFKAVGLYQQRAIVYTKDRIELKQYHYHHWKTPRPLLTS